MKKFMTYKCSVCGNIISVEHVGGGQLVCCGKPMELLETNSIEAPKEKHIPVLSDLGNNRYKVVVGEIEHPMTSEHYIEWIKIFTEKGNRLTFFLNVGDKPEVTFSTDEKIVSVEIYCNLHGLWKNK